MSIPFSLHPQLEADSHAIGRLSLSRVLLLDDMRFPWIVLVPEQVGLTEIIDLSQPDQHRLMDELALAAHALKALYKPDKLNIGALGNRVSQLHLHVIARFTSDDAWPGPVWGTGAAVPYPPHMAAVTRDRIASALQPHGLKGLAE